jgi:ectoine hydroxylase-related dioxygenase (phytanoyl-CoA dioxygenase family)
MIDLDDDQLAAWSDLGWLVLHGALSAQEIDRLQSAVDRVAAWATTDGGPGLHHHEQTQRGPTIARSEHFADDEPVLGAFVRGPLLGRPLARLFGEPAVLFKEKVNYKHPGGAGFAPHQDAVAYRFVDHHISVMVPLDPATVTSGCLEFAPGHTRGRLPTDERGRVAEATVAELAWRPVEVEPGDLVLFDSYAPHRSGTNLAEQSRRALYLTYNAASAGDFRDRYYADKLAEFAREGDTFSGDRVRLSLSDDFLGQPVPTTGGTR